MLMALISEINDVKDIASDATASFIALRDVTDGDIDYLFIQEADNGKQDRPGVSTEVSGVSLSDSGAITVNVSNAPAANKTYTVKLEKFMENSEKWMEAGVTSVTVSAGTTSGTGSITIPASSGSIYRVVVDGVNSNNIVK